MNIMISAIAYYLPAAIDDAGGMQRDNPDWDVSRLEEATGIESRYIAAPDETVVDMAEKAALKLVGLTVNPECIDFIVLVTQSADYALPASACILQKRLGLNKNCMAFDVNLGCSGYVYGLAIAGGLIASGLARQGLLLCGDTFSRYVDPNDRSCRPIFGDAAAATLLVQDDRALVGPFEMGTDGNGVDNLIVKAGGFRNPEGPERDKKVFMHGSNVFLFSLNKAPLCVRELLKKADLEIEDIDLFVFHQASKLIIEGISKRLNLPKDKVFTNYRHIGNTVSSTIPIALSDAVKTGHLKKGHRVMLVGFGVGYSWGGCIIQWEGEA